MARQVALKLRCGSIEGGRFGLFPDYERCSVVDVDQSRRNEAAVLTYPDDMTNRSYTPWATGTYPLSEQAWREITAHEGRESGHGVTRRMRSVGIRISGRIMLLPVMDIAGDGNLSPASREGLLGEISSRHVTTSTLEYLGRWSSEATRCLPCRATCGNNKTTGSEC